MESLTIDLMADNNLTTLAPNTTAVTEPWTTNTTTEPWSNTTTTTEPWSNTTTEPHTVQPSIAVHVPMYTLVLACISSVLSILGCFAILFVFIKFRDLRSTSKKLLMYLTIADLFTAAGNLIGVIRYIRLHYVGVDTVMEECDDPGLICKIQSFVTTSSSLMSFLWMMVLSGYFHISVWKGNRTTHADQLMIGCHILCWVLPVVIVSWAAGFELLGEDQSLASGSWCWLTQCPDFYNNKTNPMGNVAWMLLSGKLFEIVCYLMMTINYVGVKITLIHRQKRRAILANHTPPNWGGDLNAITTSDEDDDETQTDKLDPGDVMFIYTPYIMLVLRIWGTLKFLLVAALGAERVVSLGAPEVILTLLQAVGDSGQGWSNFILFCLLTDEVKNRIVVWYRGGYQPLVDAHHDPQTGRGVDASRAPVINTATAATLRRSPLNTETAPLLNRSWTESSSSADSLKARISSLKLKQSNVVT